MDAIRVYIRDADFEDLVIPGCVPGFAAEDEGYGWVEELEGFGPLGGGFGVVFCGHLADLPWAPHLCAFVLVYCKFKGR